MNKETSVDALTKATELAGGQSALALQLTIKSGQSISPARIWNWINRDGGAPPEFCAYIEEIVDKKVTRQELRPNDWQGIWPELAGFLIPKPERRNPRDQRDSEKLSLREGEHNILMASKTEAGA